jgi:pseudaminic acid synthase
MIKAIRETGKALGEAIYDFAETTKRSREFSRLLSVVKDIRPGAPLTEDYVRSIRPGYGLHLIFLKDILIKKAKKEIKKGTPLSWDLLI